MVAVTKRDQVGWLSPAPCWPHIGDLNQPEAQQRFLRPSILRFASDEFMEELGAVLAYHPDSDCGPTHEDHPMLNRTWDVGG